MYYVGLDLSLRSSGCAIWNKKTDIWHCVSFAANETQIGSFQVKKNVFVIVCPMVPGASTKPVLRYKHVVEHLMHVLCNTIPESHRNATHVAIEEYCAKTNQRTTAVRLHESGGINKFALESNNFVNVQSVVNCRWKACVVGKGNASKLDTVKWVSLHGPRVDFLKLFAITTLRSKNGVFVVPSPVQDFADAIALCQYAHDENNHCLQKPLKKPKIVVVQPPEIATALAERLERKRKEKKQQQQQQQQQQQTSQWQRKETPKK